MKTRVSIPSGRFFHLAKFLRSILFESPEALLKYYRKEGESDLDLFVRARNYLAETKGADHELSDAENGQRHEMTMIIFMLVILRKDSFAGLLAFPDLVPSAFMRPAVQALIVFRPKKISNADFNFARWCALNGFEDEKDAVHDMVRAKIKNLAA